MSGLSVHVQHCLEGLMPSRQEIIIEGTGDGQNTLILKADKRVVALLTALVVSIGSSAWYFGAKFVSLQENVHIMANTMQHMSSQQDRTITLFEDLQNDIEKNNHRLIRLEEWRTMTAEWSAKIKESNPTLVVPPIPDGNVPRPSEYHQPDEVLSTPDRDPPPM